MILVLDTETTGLPVNYKAPVSDVENWPRLVQIAWAIYSNDGELIGTPTDFIIKPEGYEIPEQATAVHGITTELALAEGIPIDDVLTMLENDISAADHVVAHNIDFDAAVIGAEFLRAGFSNSIEFAPKICTMRSSVEYCAIPGKNGGLKFPKLGELYYLLVNSVIDSGHNAKVDMAACARCFFELIKLGVIVIAQPKPNPQAEPLFSPASLQKMILVAYTNQDQTRMTLHHNEHTVWEAQRELDGLNYELRKSEAYQACKNEQQRADYLYGNNEERVHPLEIARVDALGSRLDFERARDEVERTRTLLRVAELAAGIALRQ